MNIAAFSPPLRSRMSVLSSRERRFLIAGALASTLFAAYLLLPEGDGAAPGVELGDPPATPEPPVPAPIAPPPPAAAPPPAASVEGIRLQGVLGGGASGGSAILALPGGQQRMVRTGREFLPGLTLKAIGVSHVIVGRSEGDVRLDLGRAGATATAPGSALSAAAASQNAVNADLARETLSYRLGLQPAKAGGRVSGFSIRPGARLPQLQRAGLRAGDLIVGVNGSVMDEERMTELAWTIANSEQTEFEFVRGGRRQKVAIK